MIFCDKFMCVDPLNVVFLCGPKFNKQNGRDKRKILKNYCESNIPNCRAIILEENFQFGTSDGEAFSYNDIFINSLGKVEQLVALYANKIIVIHESISTAAEIGMFAVDPKLVKKICLLIPDAFSIDEDKTAGFISLAFLNKHDEPASINSKIVFYPDIVISRKSNEISSYHTYFHNDSIGKNLGNEIISFVRTGAEERSIRFVKKQYKNHTDNSCVIDYCEDEEERIIRVFVHTDVLKSQLLSLLTDKDVKYMLRQKHTIFEHVTSLSHKYCETLLKTVARKEGRDYSGYTVDVTVKNFKCSVREAIGMFFYLLQAAGIVNIERCEDGNDVIIASTGILKKATDAVSGYLQEEKPTSFRGLAI